MTQLEALEDFDAARYRAFRRAVRAVLTRRRRELLSLEGVLSAFGRDAQSSGEVQEILLDRVVGSADVGRAKEFDASFLPQTRRLMDDAGGHQQLRRVADSEHGLLLEEELPGEGHDVGIGAKVVRAVAARD
jgi:hypothetical protein